MATVTTNEKGIAEVKDLPLGDYFVKEISAPEGYIKVDTPVKVTIENTNVIELVMKNTKKVENGQFKLLKKIVNLVNFYQVQNLMLSIKMGKLWKQLLQMIKVKPYRNNFQLEAIH
ncbi:prealbumin-like fold domain-containing protein [Bacillus thuringiensis]